MKIVTIIVSTKYNHKCFFKYFFMALFEILADCLFDATQINAILKRVGFKLIVSEVYINFLCSFGSSMLFM